MMSTEPTYEIPPGFKLRHRLEGHTDIVNRIAWSPDGNFLASPSTDKRTVVWAAKTGWIYQIIGSGEKSIQANFSVAWAPDGRRLISSAGLMKSEKRNAAVMTYHCTAIAFQLEPMKQLWEATFDENIGEFAWSPDGRLIAAAGGFEITSIHDATDGRLIRKLANDLQRATVAAWSPDGRTLAAGNYQGTITLWDTAVWKQRGVLEGHRTYVWSVAWSPAGNVLASGSEDMTVRVWDTRTGKQITILEGHTGPITSLSFSFDGRLLATKGDDAVRLWRCDNWELLSTLNELGIKDGLPGLAFHPKEPALATLGESNTVIRIWDLDFDTILGKKVFSLSNRYSNAKVVLIGDTGVGKSGLALGLTGQKWEPTDSTHGRRVWVMGTEEAENKEGLKETRETLLWDLAGQPDYRLIHQLHLTEVAVALVVFDSRSQTDPFAGVRHWDKALRQARRVQGDSAPPIRKFLIGARADVGRIGVSRGRVEELMRRLEFDAYFETSAKEGWGVGELAEAIRGAIGWGELPKVSSTKLFQDIKTFLVAEKETGRLLSTLEDLYRAYLVSPGAPPDGGDLRAQFETCIGRVESRGLIQRLSFGDLVLLQPELQDVYASAMANAVKDEPDGLGCIHEQKARAGEFRIPESERIGNKEQEKLLLISTVEELLRHEIALREPGADGEYLVFPSQLTRENPDLPDPEGKAVIFDFEGPVLNVYATLAVRLSYSGFFRKKEMWKNAATYAAIVGGTCGMFLREVDEGRGELTLFFDAEAAEETRFQFEEFVHTHLRRRALNETVRRRRVFVCQSCGTAVSDTQARRRRERDFDWMSCPVCDERISLRDREERLTAARASKVQDMDRAADAGRDRATARSVLQGKIATEDFDVFLCHNSADKEAVKEVGERLKERGLLPWLDVWELRPGSSWQDVLEEQIGKIKAAAVFVGSNGVGPWQQEELKAFLRQFVERKCPVIPVILPDAPKEPALPIFLQGKTWVDFRAESSGPLEQLVWGITGERPSGRHF